MKAIAILLFGAVIFCWAIFFGGDFVENHTNFGRRRNIEITTAFVKKVVAQETLTRKDIESVPRDVKMRDSVIESVASQTGLTKDAVLQCLDEDNVYFVAKTRILTMAGR